MSLQLDDSQYPRVVLRWTGAVTDDELKRVLSAIDGWLAREEPFGLLIDSRGGWPFTAAQRGWVIDHMRATRAKTEQLLVQALIIDSPLVRALYYAMSWAVPMPFPSQVFTEEPSARAWLEEQLKARARQRRETPPRP